MTNTDDVPEEIDPDVLESGNPQSVRTRRPFYAYIVAAFGALFVLGGAFLAIMLIPTVLFPAIYESIPGMIVMYVVGTPLAILASALSFRATLRAYSNR